MLKAHRMHGHLAAKLDPLVSEPEGDPALDPETVGLTPELMARIPAKILRTYVPGATLADALPHLRETYCGTIAYEIEHIASHRQRTWLREKIESGAYRTPLTNEEQRTLLRRLTQVDSLERFMHKAYLGQKQFSIEGLDMTIPMLDEMIQLVRLPGRARGRHRHGAPRAAQRPRPHRRARVRDDLPRVRGRLLDRGGDHDPAGRHRRRQVPPRRPGHLPAARRVLDHRAAGVQPEPPRVRRPGGRGRHARDPDDAPGPARAPGQQRGDPGDPARRRRLPGPGRRGGDVQPPGAGRLHRRRRAAPDPEQPGRLHHRPGRLALDALGLGPREGLRRADHPRQRRRRRGVRLRRAARVRVPPGVRPRRADRPDRLPPLRPQRGRRAGLHAAGDGGQDQGQDAGPRPLRRAAGRAGRGHPGGGRRDRQGDLGEPRRAPPRAQGRAGGVGRGPADGRLRARPLALARGQDGRLDRPAARGSTRTCCGSRRASPSTRSSPSSSSAGARRSGPTAASTGRRPSRSPSRRC